MAEEYETENRPDAASADQEEPMAVQETPDQAGPKEAEEPVIQPAQTRRTDILWVIAGLYLIYNGYGLCKSVISGAEGASPWFLVAGIAFIGIGGFLMVKGGLNLSREEKAKREEAEKGQTQDSAARGGLFSALTPPAPKEKAGMSIAERARLAGREDQPADERAEQAPDAETEEAVHK